MTMRRSQKVGTKYDPQVDAALDRNQASIVDELTTPHVRIPENLEGGHKICASYAPHHDPQMPIRGQGAIVWNKSYSFQSKGPSYLDPTDV